MGFSRQDYWSRVPFPSPHSYMTTGKTIFLMRWTFVGKVTFLLFNMLSRLVITFLPWSKHLLFHGCSHQSAVNLEPKKKKSVTVSIVSPSICYKVMGSDPVILVFWMLSFKPTLSLSFLLAILIPAYVSSSPACLMMCSADKLNKWSDNIQPWNQSVVPCRVLTVTSWPAYRFLRRQVRWSGIPILLRVFHSLLWYLLNK